MSNEHTTHDGGPAFPRAGIWDENKPGWTSSPQAGMSLLEYFAAHAPAEIPDWFELPPVKYPPQIPVPAVISLAVEKWETGQIMSLHDHFQGDQMRREVAKMYLDARNEHKRQCEAIDADRKVELFYAWRWTYATKMVEMRNSHR